MQIENVNSNEKIVDKLLLTEIIKSGKQASQDAMKIMGYTVIAKDGYVVKKFADGTIKKIKKI